MSAILSADDLNDFINPGIACIKPVETLPKQRQSENKDNPYEVTTEEIVDAGSIVPPAQISLTDCLACSGCVTSAEAVLVSLQSHGEVLNALDKYEELSISSPLSEGDLINKKLFVASVSPQSRASLAATYNMSDRQAGYVIDQLLKGPLGLRSGGTYGTGFTWVFDTNRMREACLVAAADEVGDRVSKSSNDLKKPVITSACPGWICYAEKTHPHILPHLSQLKSPQALSGVLIKSVLAKKYGISPENIWHLAIMPCFDKKLEASRSELTSQTWHNQPDSTAVRDVDCVITARELLMLAETRNISFPRLPATPLPQLYSPPFPDPTINTFLNPPASTLKRKRATPDEIGTSGGYLHHILLTKQAQFPNSTIHSHRGRNADVHDFTLRSASGNELFRASRYYGFRNIQNLVRRLKPAKASRMLGAMPRGAVRRPGGGNVAAGGKGDAGEAAYVEVMACPGGCTNGGGQIKVGDVMTLRQGLDEGNGEVGEGVALMQREWLAKVDEAYWSAEEGEVDGEGGDEVMVGDGGATSGLVVDGIDVDYVKGVLRHWSSITGIELDVLLKTTYRVVESDVGKSKAGGEVDRVSALAHAAGGGW